MEEPQSLHKSEGGKSFFRLLVSVPCARGGHGLSKESQVGRQHDMLQRLSGVGLTCW